MGKFDSYKIDLRGMREVDASYDLNVDNEFFAHIDGPEVLKGRVQVKLDVHRSVDVYEMAIKTLFLDIIPYPNYDNF